jgi:anti-sigma factor RsiW
MTHESEGLDTAAYALGSLEDPRLARLEAHVRACPDCAKELAEYEAVAGILPFALEPEAPPREAWEALLARVRGRHEARSQRRSIAALRLARPGRVIQPVLWVALAAAVIGLLFWNASLQRRFSHQSTTIGTLASLPAESVVPLGGPSPGAGFGGRLYVSADRHQGGLVVNGLPVLQAGRAYQVWFVRPDQSRASSATFRVDTLGQAIVEVAMPRPLDQFDGVAVTEEPEEGSSLPTSRDLLAGPIYER